MTKFPRNLIPSFLEDPARNFCFRAATIVPGASPSPCEINASLRLCFKKHRETALLRSRVAVPAFPRVNEPVGHLVKIFFLKLRRLHEVVHVIRFCFLKLLPFPETRSFGLMSNLLRNLCPARESPPEVSQKVSEAFLSHLRIWDVKRHWSNM